MTDGSSQQRRRTSMPDPRVEASQPSIFEKCHAFFDDDGQFSTIKKNGLYPYFRPIERNDGTRAIMNGREIIMAGSNNYLGLVSDPRVRKAASDAIAQYGTGCTGSRFLNGTLDIHIELEERLAKFMQKDACILYSTGFMTNQGVIEALTLERSLYGGRSGYSRDIIFSDKDNHACILAGTKVSTADTWRYRHDDMSHLRKLLEKASDERPEAGKLIVTDGVFSMSGVIAKVPELVELADEFGAALMLDDAHAVGVIGEGGRGSAAYYGLQAEVPITTGTFSKSFASLGGFCVGESDVIEFIRHHSSTHIFSASMPPSNVATVLKSLEILEKEPERLERLWKISDYMREGFRSLGFNVWTSQAPIIPVVIGDMNTSFIFWKRLLEEGVFVNAVVPPAVPRGQSLMRTSYMATHSDEELDFILEAFERVGKELQVIGSNGQAEGEAPA